MRSAEGSSSCIEKLKKLLDKTDFEKSVSNISTKKQNLYSDAEDVSLSETLDSLDNTELLDENEVPHLSGIYFKCLFYACIATFLYRNVWMFILAAIPISLHLLYTLGNVTGVSAFISNKINEAYEKLKVLFSFTVKSFQIKPYFCTNLTVLGY